VSDNQISWDERRRLALKDTKKKTPQRVMEGDLMHEDELPENMPQADYDKWYAQSFVPDGVGCRVGPKYPWEAKQ
jgi:hypothetical protein